MNPQDEKVQRAAHKLVASLSSGARETFTYLGESLPHLVALDIIAILEGSRTMDEIHAEAQQATGEDISGREEYAVALEAVTQQLRM